jgi:hypothetical protein
MQGPRENVALEKSETIYYTLMGGGGGGVTKARKTGPKQRGSGRAKRTMLSKRDLINAVVPLGAKL